MYEYQNYFEKTNFTNICFYKNQNPIAYFLTNQQKTQESLILKQNKKAIFLQFKYWTSYI